MAGNDNLMMVLVLDHCAVNTIALSLFVVNFMDIFHSPVSTVFAILSLPLVLH
jgi:hypothetical protein